MNSAKYFALKRNKFEQLCTTYHRNKKDLEMPREERNNYSFEQGETSQFSFQHFRLTIIKPL